MKMVTFEEYEAAKLEIIKGKEYEEDANMDEHGVNRKTYSCKDGSTFWEVTENGVTEFWSTAHSESRMYVQPKTVPAHEREEFCESRQKAITRMHKLVYWFADEMLSEEDKGRQEREEFERQKAERPDEQVFMVSCSEHNAKVMKECMREARDAAEFLKNRENNIEEWQLAGINAMCDQCDAERIIPYDLPSAVKGLLCMHLIEDSHNK